MKIEKIKNLLQIGIILCLILLTGYGCAVSQRTCLNKGISYCRILGNFTDRWYDYYERSLSCIEGECYDAAIEDLNEAIRRRDGDQRMARTFGMHFIDYFPHREKGLVYYLQSRYDEAKIELETSIKQYPSAKAQFYMDEVRRRIMKQEQQHPSKPDLSLTFPGSYSDDKIVWTNADPVTISGIATDEQQFISEIFMTGRPIFIESSNRQVEFIENLTLDQGGHEIDIVVRNLMGGETRHRIFINVDRIGPVIVLEKFVPGVVIEGYVFDESDGIALFANDMPVKVSGEEEVRFNIPLKAEIRSVSLVAKDKLGNETRTYVDADMSACKSPMIFAQNLVATDGDRIFAGSKQALEIILPGWSDDEKVFKESIHIQIIARSEGRIDKLDIDNKSVLRRPGRIVSLNHFVRLKEGINSLRITASDDQGKTAVKEFRIIREIPAVFQLKQRYSLALHPFDAEGDMNRAVFQHWFLTDMIDRKRFQVDVRKDLEDILRIGGFNIPEKNVASVHAVLLGVIYETKAGIEIAARLIDIESRETLATVDVYDDSKDLETLMVMARQLSEKFHRSVPIMDGTLTQITSESIKALPQKWMPVKGELKTRWPLIVYREKDMDARLGSDTEIICDAVVEHTSLVSNFGGEMGGIGSFIIIPEKKCRSHIGLNDRVVSR